MKPHYARVFFAALLVAALSSCAGFSPAVGSASSDSDDSDDSDTSNAASFQEAFQPPTPPRATSRLEPPFAVPRAPDVGFGRLTPQATTGVSELPSPESLATPGLSASAPVPRPPQEAALAVYIDRPQSQAAGHPGMSGPATATPEQDLRELPAPSLPTPTPEYTLPAPGLRLDAPQPDEAAVVALPPGIAPGGAASVAGSGSLQDNAGDSTEAEPAEPVTTDAAPEGEGVSPLDRLLARFADVIATASAAGERRSPGATQLRTGPDVSPTTVNNDAAPSLLPLGLGGLFRRDGAEAEAAIGEESPPADQRQSDEPTETVRDHTPLAAGGGRDEPAPVPGSGEVADQRLAVSAPSPSPSPSTEAGPAEQGESGRAVAAWEDGPQGIAALTNQEVEIELDGSGWVYIGESGGRRDLSFLDRSADNTKTAFRFRFTGPGDYALSFTRQDLTRGISDNISYPVAVTRPRGPAVVAGTTTIAGAESAASRDTRVPAAGSEADEPADDALVGAGQTGAPAAAGPSSVPDEDSAGLDGVGPTTGTSGGGMESDGIASPAAFVATNPGDPLERLEAALDRGDAQGAASLVDELGGADALSTETLLMAGTVFMDASLVARAIGAFESYRVQADGRMSFDELHFRLGALYESDSERRNMRTAKSHYETVVDDYPLSPYWEDAVARIEYLDRHFFHIR